MPENPKIAEPMLAQSIADMPWVDPPTLPPTDLPYDDGEPMESPWHFKSAALLVDSIIASRGGVMENYYVGANMFVYYSWQQVRNKDFNGPDVFFANDAEGQRQRLYWAIWDEDGRYPNAIFELLSESTERHDLGKKKDLYERTFHAAEYFCIAPDVERLYGWRLSNSSYVPITPDEHGRLWSEQLGCAIGAWHGTYMAEERTWPRLYQPGGGLVPLQEEAERQRADTLAARVAELEAEVRRLRGEG
jgi:Uma2 family endonuclease